MENKSDNFKKELKELLSKYNAEIYFTCSDSSDTYGLYEDHIAIDVDGETIIEANGWCLNSGDIRYNNTKK